MNHLRDVRHPLDHRAQGRLLATEVIVVADTEVVGNFFSLVLRADQRRQRVWTEHQQAGGLHELPLSVHHFNLTASTRVNGAGHDALRELLRSARVKSVEAGHHDLHAASREAMRPRPQVLGAYADGLAHAHVRPSLRRPLHPLNEVEAIFVFITDDHAHIPQQAVLDVEEHAGHVLVRVRERFLKTPAGEVRVADHEAGSRAVRGGFLLRHPLQDAERRYRGDAEVLAEVPA
mmetsp:Transcript_5577/g.21954  ORF Transcript_5577/g.21954 Transcript_5577/m.21954 type:complete len:233 (+) Transcript_5577:1494-2192(+)